MKYIFNRSVLTNFISLSLALITLFLIPMSLINIHPAVVRLQNEDDSNNTAFHLHVMMDEGGLPVVVFQQTKSIRGTAEMMKSVSHLREKSEITLAPHDVSLQQFDFLETITWNNLWDTRFLLVHLVNEETEILWKELSNQPYIEVKECMEPSWFTFAKWNVCLAEFSPEVIRGNVQGVFGWSPAEGWGAWTIDEHPRANFYVHKMSDHILNLEVFPYCVENKKQSATVYVNTNEIGQIDWSECETKQATMEIPRSLLVLGDNELAFEFKYAISPAENSIDSSVDPRQLAVGFNKILIRPIADK